MIFCGKYYGKTTLNSHHNPNWGNKETEFPRQIKWKNIKATDPWKLCDVIVNIQRGVLNLKFLEELTKQNFYTFVQLFISYGSNFLALPVRFDGFLFEY